MHGLLSRVAGLSTRPGGCGSTPPIPAGEENLAALSSINHAWVSKAIRATGTKKIILDMDSSESPVHGGCPDFFACLAVSSNLDTVYHGGIKSVHLPYMITDL
jgi:hypothetical protein